MGYVAVKGGTEAVNQAEKTVEYFRVKGCSKPIEAQQIMEHMRLSVGRVMSEGSLYAPELAALALKQSEGDSLEAAFILRAYRSTVPRDYYSVISDTSEMRVIRRISSTFKDIPGGQILGPTRDYTVRLLNMELLEETEESVETFIENFISDLSADNFEEQPIYPKIINLLRKQGVLSGAKVDKVMERPDCDITRDGLVFPASRSARLQTLARGETGGMIALAYTTMRGYGNTHPALGELRVGYLPVKIIHPLSGESITIGEIMVTEAEIVSENFVQEGDAPPVFTIGYGLCFGHNEEKAIAMGVLENAMDTDTPSAPAQDEEFVLSHIDGIESSGFTAHWKLPHYVTFQSALDRIRKARADTSARERRTGEFKAGEEICKK